MSMPYFKSDTHAFLTGQIFAMLMQQEGVEHVMPRLKESDSSDRGWDYTNQTMFSYGGHIFTLTLEEDVADESLGGSG